MTAHRIVSLTATLDGAVAVTVEGRHLAQEEFITAVESIQLALATAFAVTADISIVAFAGTRTIRRIEAFDVAPEPEIRPGMISRLATQRRVDLGAHVLEVFVRQKDGSDKQVLAQDLAVQRMCHVAALSRRIFRFQQDDEQIVAVTVAAEPA